MATSFGKTTSYSVVKLDRKGGNEVVDTFSGMWSAWDLIYKMKEKNADDRYVIHAVKVEDKTGEVLWDFWGKVV